MNNKHFVTDTFFFFNFTYVINTDKIHISTTKFNEMHIVYNIDEKDGLSKENLTNSLKSIWEIIRKAKKANNNIR